MTQRQMLQRLITIAAIDHRPGSKQPWTSADLVDQDTLYTVQSEVLALLLDLAKGIGPDAEAKLVAKFPWAYSTGCVSS